MSRLRPVATYKLFSRLVVARLVHRGFFHSEGIPSPSFLFRSLFVPRVPADFHRAKSRFFLFIFSPAPIKPREDTARVLKPRPAKFNAGLERDWPSYFVIFKTQIGSSKPAVNPFGLELIRFEMLRLSAP